MADVASPTALRLPRAGWRDSRLLVGVLLVVGSMVLGARVVAAADDTVPVWAVRGDVAPGTVLTADDLVVRQVRLGAALAGYRRADASPPVGEVALRPLSEGELLPASAVAAEPAAARRLVTVPVERFHRPAALARGDRVDVFVTPPSDSGRPAAAPRLVLSAAAVAGVDDEGSRFGSTAIESGVVLAVAPTEAVALVSAARRGAIDLVLVPASEAAGQGTAT